MSHFTEVCTCGTVLSQCRCPSPNKSIKVSEKPCTHDKVIDSTVDQKVLDAINEKYANAFGLPVQIFEQIMDAYLSEKQGALDKDDK